MALPNPGPSIQWTKLPSYSTSLVSLLLLLPRTEAHALFITNKRHRSADWVLTRATNLRRVTESLFTAVDEAARRKQVASVERRLVSLGKSYSFDIMQLQFSAFERATLDPYIRSHSPWWDDLRSILRDHPDFVKWDENAPPPEEEEEEEEEDFGEENWDGIDEAMQGIEYESLQRHPPDPDSSPRLAALPAAAPPPPQAQLQPPHPDELPSTPGISHCPTCDLPLHSSTSEAHLRQCLDSGGGYMSACPICDASLEEMGKGEGERHVEACCNGGAVGKVADSAVFVCDGKTLPRDDETNAVAECGVCMEDFETGTRLTRLSCYCVYHEECVSRWWTTGGGFCPLHKGNRPAMV